MSRPRRVLGYARVSSVEQASGSSLSDQQASIANYARSRGFEVTRFYVESESGGREKIERREQMKALTADVRSGDLVLVDKLDRWSRDPEFTYGSVRRILEAGANFYAVSEQCDPSTRDGDSMMGFRILFAREEHKRIRERTVGTRELLRAKGYFVEGTPPFGYRRALPKGSKGAEKNVLVPVPEQAALVRRMFAMSIAGDSLGTICATLGLAKKRVWSSLHCRTYIGEVRTKNGWIKGLHQPILTADIFERASTAFSARRYGGPRGKGENRPSQTDTWFLRDLARCARCGGKMTSAYGSYFADGKRRHYYRCFTKCPTRGNRATNGTFVPVLTVEAEVSNLIVAQLEDLREELASGPEIVGTPTIDHAAKLAKLARRREKYLEAHAEELMTLAELREKLSKVDAERLRIEAEVSRENALSSPQERRSALRDLGIMAKAWKRATTPIRREIARRLMTECAMAVGTPPRPKWRDAHELVSLPSFSGR